MKTTTIYKIRDREAGNEIDQFDTLAEAQDELESFEQADREAGNYTPDFYEIKEELHMRITKKQRKELQAVYGKHYYKVSNNGELHYRKYTPENGGYWYWAFGGWIDQILRPASNSQHGIL